MVNAAIVDFWGFFIMAIIYSLSNPTSGKVKYIGLTDAPLELRLRNHINSKKKHRINDWIKKLKSPPKIDLIEVCEHDLAHEREAFWISHFIESGSKLLNKYHNNSLKSRQKPRLTTDC